MCKGSRPGLIRDRGITRRWTRLGPARQPRAREDSALAAQGIGTDALSLGESASWPRRPALSATPLFSSRGVVEAAASPDPPRVVVALLAIPPLACRRPRTRPRAPTPFNPPLGGAPRSPLFAASAGASKLYPPFELLQDVQRVSIYIRLVPEMAADSVGAGAVGVTALLPARQAVPNRCWRWCWLYDGGVFFFGTVIDFGGTYRWAEEKWERSTEYRVVACACLFLLRMEPRGLWIERVLLSLLVSKQ